MAIRYAEDKPKSCEYCYFWNEKKKECRQMRCFYQLPEKPPDPDPAHRFWVPCKGCPYGRNPCIGYCMAKILKEQRKKQSGLGYIHIPVSLRGGSRTVYVLSDSQDSLYQSGIWKTDL